MVCPTCFCTTTEDSTDLTGEHAERSQRWGLVLRTRLLLPAWRQRAGIGASRYRQWITHKLSTWHDQFGGSGCVGCGRCIAWCPVGIDITAEVTQLATLRESMRTGEDDPGDEP
jgi:ferredoxin